MRITGLQRQWPVTGFDEFGAQLFKGLHRRKLRKLIDNILRRMEQDSDLGFRQHRSIVVGITSSNYPIVQAMQRLYRGALGIGLAQLVIDNPE